MIRKIVIILQDLNRQIGRQNISAFAASTAFFFFLSMVPMLIMVCTIIPYTSLTEGDLAAAVTKITPDVADPLVESLIAEVYAKSAGILSIAAITTLWSAGKGVLALMRGLNAINGVVEERNYFIVRIIASMYTIIMLVVIVLSLFIMVFGNELLELIVYSFPKLDVIVSFLMRLRFLFIWIVLTILFSALYAYVPNKKLRIKEQIPGAAFAAVVWGIFSWGFSLYVGYSQSYSIYGSLSIIVIIMVWMYMCMQIIMIGAYLNRYFRPINRMLFQKNK